YLVTILRPESSIFFPYTTLFRSEIGDGRAGRDRGIDHGRRRARGRRGCGRGRGRSGWGRRRAGQRRLGVSGWRKRNGKQEGKRQDRKSTRLNSSHQIISYAVFCL